MRITTLFCRAAVAGGLLAGMSLASIGLASAAPVSPDAFTCGVTVFTQCNQTAHFNTPSGTADPEVGTPSPQATGCPAFVTDDAVLIQGTGNGIEHSIVNKAGDGWFTSTFTGTVTLTPYIADMDGNPVRPDPNAPILTGHLTQWFGGSFNNKNFVNHDTINFTGTGSDGSSLSFHAVDHESISASAAPAPNMFSIAHC